MFVTVHGSVCSFCVRLWGGPARCACQRCLAPDEVIRTVTGVARLPCLYLAGVSVMRCQIVVSLVVPYFSVSVFQVRRLFSPGHVSVYSLTGPDCILCPGWKLCTAGFTAPALPLRSAPARPMISAPPLCSGVCTCTASSSSHPLYFGVFQIKILFSLAIGSRAFCTVTERSDQDGSSECVRIKRLFSSQ